MRCSMKKIRLIQYGVMVVAVCAACSSFAAERFVSYGGIYPHLAMFNGEGECGTGAVVPWAGDLWVVVGGDVRPARADGVFGQALPHPSGPDA